MSTCMPTNYEYISENEIDDELKCVICKQPFQYPVSLAECNHTFCKECIETWLYQNQTCPICRRTIRNYFQGNEQSGEQYLYVSNKVLIVLNQLDHLLVRCLLCRETNIQRAHWYTHEKHCLKRNVSCSSADIECPWRGPREKLAIHLNHCPYQRIRPLIDEVIKELKLTHVKQLELKPKITKLERKVTLILKLIGHRNKMVSNCSITKIKWKYNNKDEYDRNHKFICKLCDRYVLYEEILLDDCSEDCICRSCVNN